LPFVDAAFAREQYHRMKKFLWKNVGFGVAGIREFPAGVRGESDIDSGPVLFDLSTSGTGFAMAGALRQNDTVSLQALLRTSELAGFSFQWNGRRRYLTAPLVGDAIMLAMKSASAWDERFLAQ
jgi:hypothetical protein